MLVNIHAKNMALIQEMDVDLNPGLNILTGETGAGKSIIIGAVNVALGAKSFKGFARDEQGNGLVELVFSVEKEEQIRKIQDMDIPVEDGLVILSRRLVNGRSVSKVNGVTVTVALIREIADLLINIHGQHEHQLLLNQKKHLEILDNYAGHSLEPCLREYKAVYDEYQELMKKSKAFSIDGAQRAKEMDFLTFEINEIEEAHLTPREDVELEEQYQKMSNAQKIMGGIAQAYEYTGSDSQGASNFVGRAIQSLSGLDQWDKETCVFQEQLLDIESLLGDLNRELSDYMTGLSFDQEEFYQTEERLNLINHLKTKYGSSISHILAYQKEKQDRLSELEDFENRKDEMTRELSKKKEILWHQADKLTTLRKEQAKALQREIQENLEDLNFPQVVFEAEFREKEVPGPDGRDEICFMISTNPGEEVKPLQEVASGGELSRIMLGVKSVMADREDTQTLIFDEIDVGISGRTAQKVSEKMAALARNHQIICITHLAQIAAMADHHYLIEKEVVNGGTVTAIRGLSQEESVDELARILGGAQITETVRSSAREMKELADRTKKY